ncbi:redoxin domain-containing protein [Micrococcales bacterium 31B]|nr:redoxin domain-containing protein [Micrococcales bacterium 31B]
MPAGNLASGQHVRWNQTNHGENATRRDGGCVGSRTGPPCAEINPREHDETKAWQTVLTCTVSENQNAAPRTPAISLPTSFALSFDGDTIAQAPAARESGTESIRKPRVRASELEGRGWLNTGGKQLTLADLKGKIVVLDFWTFCCVNCLHVLDELRELEARHRDVLVIVGVHSPKFVHEADPVALAAAVERYEVEHPVLDDPNLVTWSNYAARAWPTLTVIDPEGYIVASMSGEGHAHNLEILVDELIAEHEHKGTLHRGDGPYVAPEPAATDLRFPSKIVGLESGNLLVTSAGQHQVVELAADAETVLRRIGTGSRGFADGDFAAAAFSEPNGIALVPAALREQGFDYDVVVADTVNHALRGINLARETVTTLVGAGTQWMQGEPVGGADPLAAKLSTPWDVTYSREVGAFIIAMAGVHQLWAFDPLAASLSVYAGTTNEGLVDGPLAESWWAQTSGLTEAPDGTLWFADSEVSALRSIVPGPDARVVTHVGKGLFDFGHVDGDAADALLQHNVGVGVLPDGSIAISDTYNSALRRFDPVAGEVTTLARDLREPSDTLVVNNADGSSDVLVVESAAHRITRISLPQDLSEGAQKVLGEAQRTQRPVTEIAPGDVRLEVIFVPPTGHKLDDQFGPSTQIQVSSTPPELLLAGAGDGTDLVRTLTLNTAIDEGVLHVAARAASCDADPAVEFPACHMHQQDWGVPVRIAVDGARSLELPLLG